MQKNVTNLWFDGRVDEALGFYTSIFENSRIKTIRRYGDAIKKIVLKRKKELGDLSE
jgi:predicted 3-demethylubiquinone-9 3-methyltransferase (glyoxalase superfamily)